MRETPENIPERTNDTPLIQTDFSARELTDEPQSTREEYTTVKPSSNQRRFQSMSVITALLLLFFLLFDRSNIESASYDTILNLSENGGVNVSAYIYPFVASFVSIPFRNPGVLLLQFQGETFQHTVGEMSHKLESSTKDIQYEAETALLTPQYSSIEINQQDSSPVVATDTSILSHEQDELSEAQQHELGDDDAEENESAGIRGKLDYIGEDPVVEEYLTPEQNDQKIQFFKLETDETGAYLVSCEKTIDHDTGDSLPTFVCSKPR